jgi:hypothetical protein
MYLKNLLNTIGQLPVTSNQNGVINTLLSKKNKLAYKGSRFSIAAFLLLMAVGFSGCDSTGSVGDGLTPGEDEVNKTTVELTGDQLQVVPANSFSGRLQRSAMGYIDDPVYGTINAVALLNPSISRAQVDTIRLEDTMSLKLSLSRTKYGSDNGPASYTIYEAGRVWRGNQLKYNSEVEVDFSTPVAQFQITDEDSIEVPLSDEWVDKFRTFYDLPSAERDSVYRTQFPGLAIVADQSNQRIHFLRHAQEEEDSPGITRFIVYTEADEEDDDDDNGNGDDDNGNGGDDEDNLVAQRLDLRDFGASVVRTNVPDYDEGILLHNGENVLRVDLVLPKSELRRKNIINAKLLLTQRKDIELVQPSIVRPLLETVRGHSFRTVPSDLVSELFATSPRFGSVYEEDEDLFMVNITQYILNEVYGDIDEGPIFISLQAINGFLYSGLFYDLNADPDKRPRIVITSVD